VPHWLVGPEVVLATLATIIASQAIITGAFSMSRQAMQLGWLPGLLVRQTSDREYGQIYLPLVNWAMMLLTVALTVAFRSSDRLAGAYGTAVSTTMLLTTVLLYHAMADQWRWPVPLAAGVALGFLVVDGAFFAANLVKIADGGWIPLLLAVVLYTVMRTWRRGVDAVRAHTALEDQPPAAFLQMLVDGSIPRVSGTAVFLSRHTHLIPSVMVRHVRDMGALHRKLASVTLAFEEQPRVPDNERLEVEHVADGFWHLTAHYGFVESPDLWKLIESARELGCELDLGNAILFAAHDDVVAAAGKRDLPAWRRMLFAFMFRNAVRTTDRFNLPGDRFVEVGRQVRV
jgi:KUP system potassium uptake protein